MTCEYALNLNDHQIENICMNDFHNLGVLDRERACNYCRALFFEKDHRNRAGKILLCCQNGKVVLPQLSPIPIEFQQLCESTSSMAVEFRNNIRTINSLFAMATFKTSGTRNVMPPRGEQEIWNFSITGQIYNHTNGIPDNNDLLEPSLNHYYFLDTDDALNKRCSFMQNRVTRGLLSRVENTLRRVNVFI